MSNSIKEITAKMKTDSCLMAALSLQSRNYILEEVRTALVENSEDIFRANRIDLQTAESNQIADSIMKRLKFDEHKLQDVCNGIDQLISLNDPINRVLLERELDEGLRLVRTSCPIGVIGIIFEARPDALVQISSLCIKSGNCAVLKGGSETTNTNRVLFDIIYRAAVSAGAPDNCMFLAEAHSEIDELLACEGSVDLIIPRGSNRFVKYIMDHTQIPVMGHADGICHTYVDGDCDLQKAVRIIVDAKTQYTAACNATETLLVDRSNAKMLLPQLSDALSEHHVKIRGTEEVNRIINCEVIADDDFRNEYLDLIIGIKLVNGVEEAISHINCYGSHHTDTIITENMEHAELFMNLVDSAGCYLNCSTRFADGFRYGFGAEVGISTSKIHARGPVGLEGLTTYKYKLYGDGHIVEDYANGTKQFHFKELK